MGKNIIITMDCTISFQQRLSKAMVGFFCLLSLFCFNTSYASTTSTLTNTNADASTTTTNDDTSKDTHLEQARAIFTWVATNPDAYISPKQELRRASPGDSNSPLSVYATGRIEPGEIIAKVPWDNIISSGIEGEESLQLPCGLVTALKREFQLGKESKYAPYIEYLLDESKHQIPSSWSIQAIDLLLKVLDDKPSEFPPLEPVHWFIKANDWCDIDPNDKLAIQAALLVIQRSDDSIMIPAYDSYNHRNGNHTNTDTNIVWEKYHVTKATKTIEPGQQIYLSYNFCRECGGRQYDYGTAEMLKDYGFVEHFPQRWHYMKEGYHFDLDQDEEGNLFVLWDKKYRPDKTDEYAMADARKWFQKEIRRLHRMKNIDMAKILRQNKNYGGMPKYQWDTIWDFVDANILAMTLASKTLQEPATMEDKDSTNSIAKNETAAETADDDNSCRPTFSFQKPILTSSHYDPLDDEPDDLPYNQFTCDYNGLMKKREKSYILLENMQNLQHTLRFIENLRLDDVCMIVDDNPPYCSSFRPQYYELPIHTAASFIRTVKRVLFIGSGNSVLLHEVLKYYDLELVVGIEFDQTVTRKSLQYFDTLPHFDDERVEWWFGDINDSLALLPEHYWGSFDIVFVDTDDETMSLPVSNMLDLSDVLPLLLKANGILIKNELWMDNLSKSFNYAMEMYYEVPEICDQVWILASNGIDFFHDDTYNHKIHTFYYKYSPKAQFDYLHDFRRNNITQIATSWATSNNVKLKDEPIGLVEILNCEETTVVLDRSIVATIEQIALKHELTIVSDPSLFDHNVAVVAMKEGYIAACIWPNVKYVAFDIYLWNMTDKINNIKKSLAEAVGSSKISSYKIVVGGIYGAMELVGPRAKNMNTKRIDIVEDGRLDEQIANIASLEEIVPLGLKQNPNVLVVCGIENQEDKCLSAKALKESSSIQGITTIHECPRLTNGSDNDYYLCEIEILDKLEQNFEKDNTSFDIIVFDAIASYEMHQIFHSILDTKKIRQKLLSTHSVAVNWTCKNQPWRKNLLDRIRKLILYDPVALSEVIFEADKSSCEMILLSIKHPRFNSELVSLERRLQSRLSNVNVAVREVKGGLFDYQDIFNPKKFRYEEYDSKPGREQFSNQYFLGRQVFFQLHQIAETNSEYKLDMSEISEYLTRALKKSQMYVIRRVEYNNFGTNGSILIVFTTVGYTILVWDGRQQITINYFTYQEMIGIPDEFIEEFIESSGDNLEEVYRDDQPRGTNRIVNFPSDYSDINYNGHDEDEDDYNVVVDAEEEEDNIEDEL